MRIKLSEIKVGDRLRRSIGDIDKLALSINKYGLLHPIIIDRENNLIAGCRRLEACKLLKWGEIEVKYMDELDSFQKKEIELEENLMRSDLTWQEQVFAKKQLDEIKKRVYGAAAYVEGGWGIEDTANVLGESASLTQRDIILAKAIEVMPELAKEKSKSHAFKRLKQERDSVNREIKIKRLEDEHRGKADDELVKVICGDSVRVLREMGDESFDMCIADPPFGVNLDVMAKVGGTTTYDVYDDEKSDVLEMVRLVIKEVVRVLKPNSHFYLFFPHLHYLHFFKFLKENFTFVDHIPLIWNKGVGGFTVNPLKRYMPHCQPIFFARKGERNLTKGMGNIFHVEPVRKKLHPAEMPSELMEILVEQSSLPGEIILDPFCGSGPVLVAAKRLRRRALGIELSEEYTRIIKEKLMEV
jgi:site-specific DNA-methyltransferase (adenine-specific)